MLVERDQNACKIIYRALNGFGHAKFAYGGSNLGSSQFTLLPQLPLKMMDQFQSGKIDSKIIILLHLSKYVTHSVVTEDFYVVFKFQASN